MHELCSTGLGSSLSSHVSPNFYVKSENALPALTCGEVVADSEVRWCVRSSIYKPIWTILRCTSYLSRIGPDDLREVTPGAEVADVNVVAAVRSWELGHFGVIHGVCEHEGDLAGRGAGANVLAIAAVTS